MTAEGGREFYEGFHGVRRDHPIEELKQRRRIEALAELVPASAGTSLFVGCGQGAELEIAPGRVAACDIALAALRRAHARRPGAALSRADARVLPYSDESFSCVICSEVIEHIPETEVVLGEIHRVLQPQGTLVLSTPNWWSFFGLARCLGEWLTGTPITSGGQPFDRWATRSSLGELLRGRFRVRRWLGSWYFPPFGRGERQISPRLTVPLVKLCMPIDRALGRHLPGHGHILLVLAEKRRDEAGRTP